MCTEGRTSTWLDGTSFLRNMENNTLQRVLLSKKGFQVLSFQGSAMDHMVIVIHHG